LVRQLAKDYKVHLLVNDFKQLQKHDLNCKEFRELQANHNVQISFVKSFGKFSQIFNPSILIKGSNIIKKVKPDFIFVENLWSGLHGMILSFFHKIPFFLDEHNVEFLRFERMERGSRLARKILKIYEKVSCNSANKVFCVSETDKDSFISKLGIDKNKIIIVPNGIDIEKFYPNEQKTMEIKKQLNVQTLPLILFFGTFSYKPNFDAVKIIRYDILPRILKKIPDAKFLIVGDKPPLEFSHNNIIFTGLVESIEDFINTSDVIICPLTSGGGTRFKILESIACGKIVISTSVGAEGIIMKGIENFLKISDDWNDFSDNVIKSLSQKNFKPSKEFIDTYCWENSLLSIKKILRN